MPELLSEPSIMTLLIVIVAALFFDYCNGWNDSANAIATVVSTRVLKPWQAVLMNAVLNFVGALMGTAVAKTIAGKFVDESLMTLWGVGAAMIAASAWVFVASIKGMPVSGSHSLMGGIVGAALGTALFLETSANSIIRWEGIMPAVVALFVSPVVGLLLAYAFLTLTVWLAAKAKLRAAPGRRIFAGLQAFSAGFMAFEHGKNDAQKVMGVITLALITLPMESSQLLPSWFVPARTDSGPEIPLWVILACATAMAAGTAAGGWKVIRTLGAKLAHIRPVEGFAAESSAGIVLASAAYMGVPISTTHTITGAILGVGSVRNPKNVKWGTTGKIFLAWVYTIPVTVIIGFVLAYLFNTFGWSPN